MSYCRNCGAKLAVDTQLCYNCGTPTNVTITILYCRRCGTQLATDAKYCYKCGTPTTGPIPPPTQTQTPMHINPPTPTPIQEVTYKKPVNETSQNNSLLITLAILLITILILIVTIVAFSPFIDIFNNQPFDQPGINIVKLNLNLLRLMI
jgi:uncharacterized membrane protein YvbJ